MPEVFDARGIVAREWASFSREYLDLYNPGPNQRREMRRAFYAGAWMMLGLMVEVASTIKTLDAVDDVAVDSVELVHQELLRFQEAMLGPDMPDLVIACERCGAHMVVRWNDKHSREFMGCSEFPRCRHTEPLPAYLEMIRLGATEIPGLFPTPIEHIEDQDHHV